MTSVAMTRQAVPSRMALVIGGGLLLGFAYTLSPLSVLSLGVLGWALVAAAKNLSPAERRWYWSILTFSVAIRVIAIALLFLTADPAHPFASFFGDEELYKFRTMWLRNIGQGIRISPADAIYSFDDVGHTSYMYVLAWLQALVGDAPYGLHVFNMALYLGGMLALYRVARAAYGGVVAMGGLVVLLFLPSLALWSISVLKEPMSAFALALELLCAVAFVRAPRWWQRVAAAGGVIALALAMESLRTGGLLAAVCGTAGGLLIVFVLSRGRRLAVAMVAAPVVVAVLASTPAVQDRVLSNLRLAAWYHAGHVLTPGYTYRLVNARYYVDRQMLLQMAPNDAAKFAAKAVWSYFTQPLPWEMKSRAMLLYLPEQMAWYVLALLAPLGIYAGLRRDLVLTGMLAAHAGATILVVAMASGNIGTLIRHRALALPYVVWLSALGAYECVRLITARRTDPMGGMVDGHR